MSVSIGQQAAAVEIAAVNLRGHLDNLADLVARRRRSQADIDMIADRAPTLEAAARTLRWLEQNEAKIKERAA